MDIATGDASPIIYIHSSVDFAELTAFYRIADICLITSRLQSVPPPSYLPGTELY